MGSPKLNGDKMGGLALPDVVRELLKDPLVLVWDSRENVYEVLDGDLFELRFNELRKVRNKVKAAGTERPFSRMYNFFVLEHGDKWARTGTKFRPRNVAGHPNSELLASIKVPDAVKKSPVMRASPAMRSPAMRPSPSPKVLPSTYARIPSELDLSASCKASPKVSAAPDGSLKRGGPATPRSAPQPAKRAKSHTPQPSPRLAPKAHPPVTQTQPQTKTLSAMHRGERTAPVSQTGYAPGDVRHPLSMLNSVIGGAKPEPQAPPPRDLRLDDQLRRASEEQRYMEAASSRRLQVMPHAAATRPHPAFLPEFALPQRHEASQYQPHHRLPFHDDRYGGAPRYSMGAMGGGAAEHWTDEHVHSAMMYREEVMPHHHIPSASMPFSVHQMTALSLSHALAPPLGHQHHSAPMRPAPPPQFQERYPMPEQQAQFAHHAYPPAAAAPVSYPLPASYAPSSADGNESDPSDGLSSGVPSPEGMISLVGDFAGSPLELDDMAVLNDDASVLEDGGLADLLFDTGSNGYDCRAQGRGVGVQDGGLIFDDHLGEGVWNLESLTSW